jgi:uncharacterized damage-inducible protein DinB
MGAERMSETKTKTMTEIARITDELRRAFDGEPWHGYSLFKILEGVNAAQAAKRPVGSAHSIWELVLHIAAWEGAVCRRMTGVAVKLSAAKNFPRVDDNSAAAWQKALAHVRETHEELMAAVKAFPEASLRKRVPGKQVEGAHYTFLFMLEGLAQHAAYHAGQIALLKKMV